MQTAPEAAFFIYVVITVLIILCLSRFGGYMMIRWYVGTAFDERRTNRGRSLAGIVFGGVGLVMMILTIHIFDAPHTLSPDVVFFGTMAVLVAVWLGVRSAATYFRRTCHGP